MPQIGIITEQGDLGFGFDNLNNRDQKIYENAQNPNNTSNTQVINENKSK